MTTHRNWQAFPWTRHEDRTDPDTGATTTHGVDGVRIVDADRGISYSVTLAGTAEGPRLRTLEIDPTEQGGQIDAAALRRVPTVALASYAATFLAERDQAAEDHGEVLLWVGPGGMKYPSEGKPSPELVAEMLKAGETRHTIAAISKRSPSTVDEWIREARRTVPGTPGARRGRKPQQTTGTDRAGSQDEENGR